MIVLSSLQNTASLADSHKDRRGADESNYIECLTQNLLARTTCVCVEVKTKKEGERMEPPNVWNIPTASCILPPRFFFLWIVDMFSDGKYGFISAWICLDTQSYEVITPLACLPWFVAVYLSVVLVWYVKETEKFGSEKLEGSAVLAPSG